MKDLQLSSGLQIGLICTRTTRIPITDSSPLIMHLRLPRLPMGQFNSNRAPNSFSNHQATPHSAACEWFGRALRHTCCVSPLHTLSCPPPTDRLRHLNSHLRPLFRPFFRPLQGVPVLLFVCPTYTSARCEFSPFLSVAPIIAHAQLLACLASNHVINTFFEFIPGKVTKFKCPLPSPSASKLSRSFLFCKHMETDVF